MIFFFFLCPQTWASQEAIVTAERAIIYSDREMSAPIGYVGRGKKIKVGEVKRNKGKVYPIIVSGKIAFIRVVDISTEQTAVDSETLSGERFTELTEKLPETMVGLSYFNFYSKVLMDEDNRSIVDGGQLVWQGMEFKARAVLGKKTDFQIVINYLGAGKGRESFRQFGLGPGLAWRVVQRKNFFIRLEGAVVYVPFASYNYEHEFRVNGQGVMAQGGPSMMYRWSDWGLEVFADALYLKLAGFNAPKPYKDISPAFMGMRLGLGINYSF